MRVLIADKFEQSGRDGLEAAGCQFSYQPDVKDDSLVEAIRAYDPEVLVVRSTKVTEPMLDAGALKLIVRAGAGYNTIDVAAASRRGVYVSNCPGKNSVAVAELALALILALDRRVADNVIQLREGKWNKKEFSKARGLLGRTLGLVGTGQIGREVVTRARAFGLNVIAWSRSLTDESAAELGVERRESLLDVARDSDIVSVHVALKPETRGLIGADFFGAMRDGAYFVNTSRGEVVDQEALRRALREKNVRAGGRRGRVHGRHRPGAEPLRHAPHRRLDRPGAGGHRRRDRPRHPHLQGDGARPERRQPRAPHALDAHARRAPPRPPRRARLRPRPRPLRVDQRAGDGERHLRRVGGGRRPHQPRRRARLERARKT